MNKHLDISLEKGPVISDQPIIHQSSIKSINSASTQDDSLVTFAIPQDPENPKHWSDARKWIITVVLSTTGFNRIMVSTIMAPALPVIAADLHMGTVEALMSMSVYLLATAFGPLVIGPLSEVYGRRPILHATNLWFLGWNVVCGFAHNKQILTAARCFAGLGAGAAYVLAGSVFGDIWSPQQRGRSLGLFAIIQNFAAAAGPILGAFITQNTTWRWIFWSTSLLQFIIMVASIPYSPETYAPLILQRKAKRLRKETGKTQLYSLSEKQHENRSPSWVLRRSLSRPIRLLLFHPIIMCQAVLAAFSYGITYLVVTTYSDLWTSQYGESISTSGLHYIAMCVGSIIGAEAGGRLMDKTFQRLKTRANGTWTPEFHLPMMLPGTVFIVIGLLWYGWAAEKRIFWINVDVGAAVLSFGQQLAGMPLQAYVIDVYPDHAGSAQAAAQLLRSLTAFGFPLFAPSMYASMGYGWSNTMLAFVSIAICIPGPVLIWVYGPRLRAVSKSSF